MQDARVLLLLLLVLSACDEDQSPTAPTPGGSRGVAFSQAPGHRVVNSLADPGDGDCDARQCTLREAINDPGSTEISFVAGLIRPITLARPSAGGGSLVIEKSLMITGPGAGIVIQRRSTDPDFRILRISSGVIVALTNLTIRNGKTDGLGGGIVSYGALTLTNSTVAGNSAASGGGISNRGGTLELFHSTVAGNSTTAGGGGIGTSLGTLILTNSVITDNSAATGGGGISDFRGTATLTNSRIVGNSATGDGGGILTSLGKLTLRKSTVARNSAGDGGGIFNNTGSLTLARSTVAGNSATNRGGGLSNEAQPRLEATLTLTNCTVSGNSAASGGGIYNTGFDAFATVGLTNSTVARNLATLGGGGIAQQGDDPSVGLTNSLVARNRAPTGADVLIGQGGGFGVRFSLIGDGSGTAITNTDGNQVGNVSPNTSPIDPRLGPLADNGGPTLTHALEAGSPALDAASTPDCPKTDQRGVLRPQGAACDIGSYERE